MVKRQTVWLSTMMVLSLMLIGYYTMNNGSPAGLGGTTGQGATVTTDANTPPSGNSSSAVSGTSTSAQATSQTSGQTASAQPAPSNSDWFVIQSTNVENNLAKLESTLSDVITNNNSSTTQIADAEQQLKSLENMGGGLSTAREAILGEGFQNCVIIPNPNGNKAVVYVQAKSITALQAAQIMNIVSQQLNIPASDVSVTAHA